MMEKVTSPLAHPLCSRVVKVRGPCLASVLERNSIRGPPYLRLRPDSSYMLANAVLCPLFDETRLGPSMREIVQFGRVRRLALLQRLRKVRGWLLAIVQHSP